MQRRSFTVFELIVTCCVIFISIGIFAGYTNLTLRVAKETALQSELNNIRMSLEYYRMIHGAYPQDLSSLTKQILTENYLDSMIKNKPFLNHSRVDKNGNLIDIFMNKYSYNKLSGMVYSQTKGYQHW